MPKTAQIAEFGGMNQADQDETILGKAFQQTESGYAQRVPLECAEMKNMDFVQGGVKQRLGSASIDDELTDILTAATDELIGQYEFECTNGVICIVAVTKKSIYVHDSEFDIWQQLEMLFFGNGYSLVEYTHAEEITQCSFAEIAGHVFIGMDGDENITKVYCGGRYSSTANVYSYMYSHMNGAGVGDIGISTVVDSTNFILSSVDQLYVWDHIRNTSLGSTQYRTITAINKTTKTITVNAATSGWTTAHDIRIINSFVNDTRMGINVPTSAITGYGEPGAHIQEIFGDRLFYSSGNALVNYTPTSIASGSGVWDLANSGFLSVAGGVASISAFSPQFSDSVKEVLYIGGEKGFSVTTGISDPVVRIEGSKTPMNSACVVKTGNWLVYLTTDKNIMGLRGTSIIDLGRRLKDSTSTGVLDSLSVADSLVTAFAMYNSNKKQAQFYFSTQATYTNDTAIIIDFKLGDPAQNEPQEGFEKRVKCHYWEIAASTNWFRGVFYGSGAWKGFLDDGTVYTLESGKNDLVSTAIDSYWKSPHITGGSLTRLKQWYRINCIFALETQEAETDAELVDISAYLDRGSTDVITATFDITSGAGGISYGMQRIDRRSKFLQIELGNDNASEEWTLLDMTLHYDIGAEISN